MADNRPDTPSSDHAAMMPYWKMVATLMGGAPAMRAAGEAYLPRFPQETTDDYRFRLANAKFTNIYRDIVENLAARPFAHEIALADNASQVLREFSEDVDARGNNLHVFAAQVFFAGISAGVDWLLIDYTAGVPAGATRADEAQMGARPYWVRVPASSLIAVYSDVIDGREQIVHARISEPARIRDGYGEKTLDRIRVLDRPALPEGGYGAPVWALLERAAASDNAEWQEVATGPISLGVIPLVPFITGRRIGDGWTLYPPMQDAAYLQVEHYQQESGLKHAKTLTAFPMLAGNGIAPPMDAAGKPMPVPVGPHSVLFAPPGNSGSGGSWAFIEPSATALRFLADDIHATEMQLRELGRQPLTAQSGNLTVVTTAYAAQKGNAAIQAWALALKDALELALVYTARWLGVPEDAEVTISTDFDIGLGKEDTFGHVLSMAAGEAPAISREAVLAEAKRRGILAPDFDPDTDAKSLLFDTDESEKP